MAAFRANFKTSDPKPPTAVAQISDAKEWTLSLSLSLSLSLYIYIYISPQIHVVTPVVLSVHSHVIRVEIIVLNVNIFVVILRQNRYVHLNESVKPFSTMKINNNLGM